MRKTNIKLKLLDKIKVLELYDRIKPVMKDQRRMYKEII